jgi:hypothetical protein
MHVVGFPFLGLFVCGILLAFLVGAGALVYVIVRTITRQRNVS